MILHIRESSAQPGIHVATAKRVLGNAEDGLELFAVQVPGLVSDLPNVGTALNSSSGRFFFTLP